MIMAFGIVRADVLDCAHSELAREKMWSRIHLIPLLQAEEDRDQVRRHLANQAREKELLGAETKVYNSDRCVVLPMEWSWRWSRIGTECGMVLMRCVQVREADFRCYAQGIQLGGFLCDDGVGLGDGWGQGFDGCIYPDGLEQMCRTRTAGVEGDTESQMVSCTSIAACSSVLVIPCSRFFFFFFFFCQVKS